MSNVEVHRAIAPSLGVAVRRLLDAAAQANGRQALSDNLALDLAHGGTEGSLAVTATDAGTGAVIGYAHAWPGNASYALELVVDPRRLADLATIGRSLLAAAIEAIGAQGGGRVNWWVVGPDTEHELLAAEFDMTPTRTLHQMRRALPTGIEVTIDTRPFVVGADEAQWLEVNNRAFAGHDEQGGWSEDMLAKRIAEDWFDPRDLLVHERDGRIAAFCWTKVHPPTAVEPSLGEIYIIAVHPDHHGRGLGRQMTLAGLDHLSADGVRTGMLWVDAANSPAVSLYTDLDFSVTATNVRVHHQRRRPALMTTRSPAPDLPTWSTADAHESIDARSFAEAQERGRSEVDRLIALFDELGVRATAERAPTVEDGVAADRAIAAYNRVAAEQNLLRSFVYAVVSTDSRNDRAQSVWSEQQTIDARLRPLLARLADWVSALGAGDLAELSAEARDHLGPLQRLAERAAHQMSEAEEHLYAELTTTGSTSWHRLHSDMTSQLTADVELPDGPARLPMPAVRGLATHAVSSVRRAAYDAEQRAWQTIEMPIASAMNAIKGEADAVNRRRRWDTPLDASLFANSVGRATFDAMQSAVVAALPDFRRWMRVKAGLHGHDAGLPWWDLSAPAPVATSGDVSWDDGVDTVRSAFREFGAGLDGLVDRALDERWIDAAPRAGKQGGAFCMSFAGDRSLVLLNWSGSADAIQTTAHELGHAYHNTALSGRTPLQKRLPMALAETASIFCETLVVESGLARTSGDERLALLDVDLQGTNQVVVDIHSRLLFETEVFARRRRRTLSAAELCEMMTEAQFAAYGDGLDQSTAHRYMWLLKPHYYGSHFYNWPYTYGLLFGIGLFARYREDPDRFRAGYDDLLSRAGMDTAEELGQSFGLDVTDEAFWTASLDVVRARIAEYERLAARVPPAAGAGPGGR